MFYMVNKNEVIEVLKVFKNYTEMVNYVNKNLININDYTFLNEYKTRKGYNVEEVNFNK